MPIYQYQCTICTHRAEISRSVAARDEAPLPLCPHHETPVAMRRIPFPENTTFNLRGEGWAGGAGYK